MPPVVAIQSLEVAYMADMETIHSNLTIALFDLNGGVSSTVSAVSRGA